MKKLLLILILCLLPTTSYAQDANTPVVTVSFQPGNELQQGTLGLIRVLGPDSLTQVRATFAGNMIWLYPTNVGDWVGFLPVGLETAPGVYTVDIYPIAGTEQSHSSQSITVVEGAYPFESIQIGVNLDYLLDSDLNDSETEQLRRLYNRVTPNRLFTDFAQPTPGPPISPFGGWRTYNDGALRGRHTGMDIPATQGTPVGAASGGRVIFATELPIHGKHIIIDHGWGILSGYSHLSDILVVPGQLVLPGHHIGLVGTTGRSQGPHLHFEIAVNGTWVDPLRFLDMSIPLAAPGT